MKKTRTLFVLTLAVISVGIAGMATVSAIGPEPSAHGSAQSGDLMLTVSAIQHQDGSVDGHATFRDRATNTKVDIDIDCLTVVGPMGGGDGSRQAIVSGTVGKSTFPDLATGTQAAFVVRDNGEGQNSPPDQFQAPGGAKGPCTIGVIHEFLTS